MYQILWVEGQLVPWVLLCQPGSAAAVGQGVDTVVLCSAWGHT